MGTSQSSLRDGSEEVATCIPSAATRPVRAVNHSRAANYFLTSNTITSTTGSIMSNVVFTAAGQNCPAIFPSRPVSALLISRTPGLPFYFACISWRTRRACNYHFRTLYFPSTYSCLTKYVCATHEYSGVSGRRAKGSVVLRAFRTICAEGNIDTMDETIIVRRRHINLILSLRCDQRYLLVLL